jgi:transposase
MDKEHCMLNARILQAQGKTQAEIAQALGVCERTIRNYLKDMPTARRKPVRGSKVDEYKALIDTILEENPFYNGELIYERLKNLGYLGKISVMKDYVAKVRRKLAFQAVLRFETEPGMQAQVDWKEFGKQTVDGVTTKLYAFVMVLGYSRKAYVRFTKRMDSETVMACHVLAFEYFRGVPKEILYDNMRTAFTPDPEGVWRPTKRLAALAVHYGFVPKRCRVRRPETKGKVERTVGYLGHNFWPRMEGEELSLAGLNDKVQGWLAMIDEKPLSGFSESRAVRYAREAPVFGMVPGTAFDARREIPLMVNRESMIRHETNSYSVPPEYIGQMLVLKVHPFTTEATVFSADRMIRTFSLAPAGARERRMDPSDLQALTTRWARDAVRVARQRRPKASAEQRDTTVDVRSPSVYDGLCTVATAAVAP